MSVHDVIRRMPDLPTVKRVSRALAVLDLVLNDADSLGCFSFDARWSETEEAALMRDRSGNEYSIVFSPEGAFAYGFDHESPMSPWVNESKPWPGLIDQVPDVFASARDEQVFWDPIGAPRATVAFWRTTADTEWRCGPVEGVDKDGADGLFEVLADGRPEAYLTFAEDYYAVALDLEPIRHVYALMPLTEYVVTSLNRQRRLPDLAGGIAEIGYPRS
ncbi:hypothetical protein E1218_33320 [Kribbella turkmenica]|uniref:Uncharacterized protein n=1 Tax=Kribbella turkmenica TaxID=2530375 RepID=A0A4V2YD75_9ACTN|nr:hypothetical protein [Kribbella turkmenica]TDD14266.1 hypothetical protein E1218_33320 [Kribbella turkmenica]